MPLKDNKLILNGNSLTIEDLVVAGYDESIVIEIEESKWEKITSCRELVDKWANEERCIYGVNTSCGGLVDHLLPKESDRVFQHNLIQNVSTQVGEFFSDTLVRMFMIARSNSLCRGYSGIKPENLKIYVEMINKYGGDLEGAVGVPEEQLRKAAQMAVCKINIDSDGRLVMTGVVRKTLAENPAEFDPRKYLGPAREELKEMIIRKNEKVLGSAGKA